MERLDPAQIKAILKQKGWKAKEVACRWEISERRMSQIVTDIHRNPYYDDAIRGLPDKK